MTQAKRFFKKNQTVLLIFAIIVLALAILLPARLMEGERSQKTNGLSAKNLLLSPVPDHRKEVNVPILMYHHIRDYNDPADEIGTNLSVPIDEFREQIEYLKNNGYSTITFKNFLAYPEKSLPEKPIIITFDDGYDDNFLNAFPLLKSNGQSAVFYIISSYIGRSGFMEESQIKQLSSNGMEIGSHSANHLDLAKTTEPKLSQELIASKNLLEVMIGTSVDSLCYPAGKFDEDVLNTAKIAEYKIGVTTINSISSTSEDKLQLSRLRIAPGLRLKSFASKIAK